MKTINEERTKETFSIDIVLECVRGLSALWVFLFHIADAFETSSPLIFTIAQYGYQGVPVFFVISGYCIYSAADNTFKKGQRPGAFLLRRLIRVMPPFWASIIVLIALPFFIEAISSIKSGMYLAPSPRWSQFTGVEWIQVLTLTRDFFSNSDDLNGGFSPINTVYWSLAIELQLYFAMYIALYFGNNWRKFLVAILGVAAFIFFIPKLNINGLFLKFWPAFFFGLLLRWMHQRNITPLIIFRKNHLWLSSLGSAILVFAILLVILDPQYREMVSLSLLKNLGFTIASAITMVLLWLLGGIEYGLLRQKSDNTRKFKLFNKLILPLLWLGQSSYSLYLLHGKLYQLPSMFIRQVISPENIFNPLLTIIATSILCFIFYKLVEIPFQTIGRTLTNEATDMQMVSKPSDIKEFINAKPIRNTPD